MSRMADFLGQQDEQKAQTTDYLGAKAPIAFAAQPALPVGGPSGAGGGPSAAPPTIAGAGVAAPAAQGSGAQQQEAGFEDLANLVFPGGDSGQGDVGGAPGGQGPATSLGLPSTSFDFGPVGVSLSPLGAQAGIRSGNESVDKAVNPALSAGLRAAGLPTSVNFLSLLSGLINSPVLSAFAGAFGMMGLPFNAINLAHALASMSPTSTTTLQAALADPNPESQITTEQAMALMSGNAIGPAVGTPMTQGTLGWSPANTAIAPRPNAPDPSSTDPATAGIAEGAVGGVASGVASGVAGGVGAGVSGAVGEGAPGPGESGDF